MTQAALLIEIGTEELPPKRLTHLSEQFKNGLLQALSQWGLPHGEATAFASPRRLAVLVAAVPAGQADSQQQKKGPAVKAAYDADGKPTKAALGFAKSCGVSLDQLTTMEQNNNTFLAHTKTVTGRPLSALLQDFLPKWLDSLQAPRKMRWGAGDATFIRPVHWLCALHGQTTLPLQWHQVTASQNTYGHRFHHTAAVPLAIADDYEASLYDAHVIASQDKRQKAILTQIEQIAAVHKGKAVIPPALLDEVTNLVEWPNALLGGFDTTLLKVPASALITAMQHHQKCFALLDAEQNLMPHFIMVSNIAPSDPSAVIKGNERVINARLNDAKFFFEKDQKTALETFNTRLRDVIFQKQLGSVYDKVERITALSKTLAPMIGADPTHVAEAAALCKADLMSEMVGEFPELQGIMGHAYARLAGYSHETALALEEIYLPRYAGDALPSTRTGLALSLADRLDTIIGIFSIGGAPTGDKDPFGLRRASIGILRLLIENKQSIDVYELLNSARENYTKAIATDVLPDVMHFFQERLKSLLHDRGYSLRVIDTVMCLNPTNPFDAYLKIQAVKRFSELPAAENLAAANKRVKNILSKTETGVLYSPDPVDAANLSAPEEVALLNAMNTLNEAIAPLIAAQNYTAALAQLSTLSAPIDAFFEHVMVMVDDEVLRQNRLLLLNHLYLSFKQIADISRL